MTDAWHCVQAPQAFSLYYRALMAWKQPLLRLQLPLLQPLQPPRYILTDIVTHTHTPFHQSLHMLCEDAFHALCSAFVHNASHALCSMFMTDASHALCSMFMTDASHALCSMFMTDASHALCRSSMTASQCRFVCACS